MKVIFKGHYNFAMVPSYYLLWQLALIDLYIINNIITNLNILNYSYMNREETCFKRIIILLQ